MPSAPERPRLALRVGITGHRAGGLTGADGAALRERIRSLLQLIRREVEAQHRRLEPHFAPAPPRLTLVSSLATGSDALAAAEALQLGYELAAPLPFPRDEYARDFETPAERAELDRLLGAAGAVLELDGRREEGGVAYERASTVMLHQSDLLVAIWDGEHTGLAGGTGDTVRAAQVHGLPIAWIDAAAPHDVRLLGAADSAPLDDRLRDALASLLEPHAAAGDDLRAAYFDPDVATGVRLGLFQQFRAILESGMDPHHAPHAEPPAEAVPEERTALTLERERADAIADHFASRYRDAFVGNYLMGGFAVVMALLAFVTIWGAFIELALIVGILLVTWLGRRGRWHERWLGFRFYAEQLRHVELLRGVGRSTEALRVPAASADDDAPTWLDWLARARMREVPMATGRVDRARLATWSARLDALLADQVSYHARTAHRNHVLGHRLHQVGTALFFVTLVVCIVHIGYELTHHGPAPAGEKPLPSPYGFHGLLTLLGAALPAFGAAFAGIASQGEFDRVAHRSRRMQRQLQALRTHVAAARASSDAYVAVTERAAAIMTEELLEWQTTFRAKPINLPA